ncbi:MULTISPECIES: hypothetical protein [Acidithiobacillus]|uniref:Uncharacterized protein n=2 Tax=Acidithiobacillus TaxID=119977 RepID=A0A179BPZ5_ACIFR|nr:MULTISPECIES: hypothetical protein [Acidithiobacillus]MEB8487440.1 hypothetical protein [Acidithiobacillus ferriphilus]MEB8491415.1 hypothetical protein [Acidithiobacillus ferriphilus]MEB8493255.1 hypothetical protein [Acidithiobacillus ferriphilus]MEB8514855.1 hypothetical protein [Acidithiobacillus ferriphilus]MEB8521000.1 hypothetical protein [Acidithiobacillus ferriphilus]
MNITIIEGEVTPIGYSSTKQGHIIAVATGRGGVRAFVPGPENGEPLPRFISIKGFIRSEAYSEGKVILEEVYAEMWAPMSGGTQKASYGLTVVKRRSDSADPSVDALAEEWIPPAFPEEGTDHSEN